MVKSNSDLMGIILAGGQGERLQRFSTQVYGYHRPKQYCTFTGTRSMFKHTIDRVSMLIPQKQLLAVVSMVHNCYVKEEINKSLKIKTVVQPCLRDTGAGILFPLLKIESINHSATVAIFPSDHFIIDEKIFMEHVQKAIIFVDENPWKIVLLGICPKNNENGYGWIEPTKEYYSDGETYLFSVKKFIEKPDSGISKNLLSAGCLLNTFVMVGRCAAFIRYITECLPQLARGFQPIKNKLGTPLEDISIRRFYKYLPSFNFSKSVLEKISNNLKVLKVNGVYWSDWGQEEQIKNDIKKFDLGVRDFVLT
jgi:mannose-1-phosphate guanylyltransferase